MTTTTLPALIQHFFTDRLCTQMEASPNTIAGYRDTFRLLLRFASEQVGKGPAKLKVDDLNCVLVGDFLAHVECERRNSARSRNTRLAAIRSFFRFVAMSEPAYMLHCQKILAMPSKRYVRRTVEFLDRTEMNALLAAPDRSTWMGRRDHADPHHGVANRVAGIGTHQSPPLRYRDWSRCSYPLRRQRTQATQYTATPGDRQSYGGLAQGASRQRRRSTVPDNQRD